MLAQGPAAAALRRLAEGYRWAGIFGSAAPWPGHLKPLIAFVVAASLLVGGCSTTARVDGVDAFGAHALAKLEREFSISPRNARTESRSHALIQSLKLDAPAGLRIYAPIDASATAQLYRNGMLVIHGGLDLRAEAALAFVVAHELAHHELGHFVQRDASRAPPPGRDFAERLELAADAAAIKATAPLPHRCSAIDAVFAAREAHETSQASRDFLRHRRRAAAAACEDADA